MSPDITVGSITYTKSFDSLGKSVRTNADRGVNQKDVLTLQHQVARDNKNKRNTRRTNLRLDKNYVESDLGLSQDNVSIVITVTDTADQARIDALLSEARALLASADPDVISSAMKEQL